MAIDFGRKRCGIAATDPLRIAGNGLCTVPTAEAVTWLKSYMAKEPVDIIVAGLPKTLRGEASESCRYLDPFLVRLKKEFPQMPIERYDERFTSALAHQTMIDGGLGKMARRDKPLVDTIAAAIILNDYLSSRQYLDSQN